MNKDLISGFDISASDINKIFELTQKLKKKRIQPLLKNKVVGLVFEKPSVRTRVSFEAGAAELGAQCIYMSGDDIRLGQREPIKDTAQVLGRYLELIVTRTFSHKHVLELAKNTKAHVINGLSDLYHPAQALADIYTIYEKKGKCAGIKMAFIGDGNNVLHSLLAIASQAGISVSVATPAGYEPDKKIFNQAKHIAKKTRAKLIHTYDPQEAVKDADFVYTDVWTSMGQEAEQKKRLRDFKNYQVNSKLLKKVGKKYMVMHCMPMHRAQEITDSVIESKASIVFDQAENRLHAQKAIMVLLLNKKK